MGFIQLIIVSFIVIYVGNPCFCEFVDFLLIPKKSDSLCLAVLKILEVHVIKNSSPIVITSQSKNEKFQQSQNDVIDCILKKLDYTLVRLDSAKRSTSRKACFNIMLLDSYESFQFLYEKILKSKLDSTGSYLILLITNSSENSQKIMGKIFNDFWYAYILDVNIIYEISKGYPEIYTYFPFSPNNCANTNPQVIHFFNETQKNNEILYPIKTQNMYGCPLTVATWNNTPFVILKENSFNNEINLEGIEGQLLLELSKKMNFTIKLHNFSFIYDELDSESIDEALQMVSEGIVNVTLGNLRCTGNRSEIYSTTRSYYQTTMVFIVHLPEPYTSLKILLFPFDKYIWISILLVCCLTLFAFTIVKFTSPITQARILENNKFPTYTMWIGLVGGGVPHPPKSNIGRFLLILWLTTSMIIRTAYQGSLYDFIRKDRHPKIPKTLQELIDENYKFITTDTAYETLKNLSLGNIETTFLSPLENLKNMEDNNIEKIVFLTPYEFFLYYAKQSLNIVKLRTVHQRVFTQHLCMIFRRHSYMTILVNTIFTRLFNTGLIDKIASEYLEVDYFATFDVIEDFKIFGMKQFMGVNIVFIFFILLSIFVFLLEIISRKIGFLRKWFHHFY